MTFDAAILRCARYLRASIPEPAKPRAKPQKSFATLQPGQHLELQRQVNVGGASALTAGTRFEVVTTTSLGATLQQLDGQAKLNVTDKNWKVAGQWKRVRRPTKRKKVLK